ncbi:hypothetical protein L208DRAFT_1345617, partial [Tricholoma matsutake]
LIKITQDESTFTMYNQRQTKWDHADAKQPEEKNEGPSLMILGMLTQEWGELEHNDGYFDNDDLIQQVELSMDIFEDKTQGFKRALFLFHNAKSQQKRVPDALSACKMVKNPKLGWTPHLGGPQMQDSMLPDSV